MHYLRGFSCISACRPFSGGVWFPSYSGTVSLVIHPSAYSDFMCNEGRELAKQVFLNNWESDRSSIFRALGKTIWVCDSNLSVSEPPSWFFTDHNSIWSSYFADENADTLDMALKAEEPELKCRCVCNGLLKVSNCLLSTHDRVDAKCRGVDVTQVETLKLGTILLTCPDEFQWY
jgi:hypothetical protein